MILRVIFVALALAAGVAQAQPYRWVDDKGNVRYTDTPPPASARSVQKRATEGAATKPAPESEAPLPYELQRAQKDFPVTLFTSPNCKEPCALAREHLNKRGIPFTETQVWNEETLAQLKERTGSDNVPALMVGRSSMSGFEPARYDALLDSATYPKAGALQARSQAAPPPPEGYEPPPTVEPAKPVTSETAGKPGPYDASGLTGPAPKPGPYDASGLTGPPPKPGRYTLPGDGGAKRP
jgi:glutaredoxin